MVLPDFLGKSSKGDSITTDNSKPQPHANRTGNKPILVVKHRDGSHVYPLEEGKPLFIGRAKECDIQLPSPAVSRRHAVILYKNGICGVKDLGSFNGTMLNNNPINEPRHLTDNDTLRISSFIIRLQSPPMSVRRGTTRRLADHPAMAEEPPAHKSEPRTFPGSDLRLPRAMEGQAGLEAMIGDILPGPFRETTANDDGTQVYAAGTDTAFFLRNEEKFSHTANTIRRVRPAPIANDQLDVAAPLVYGKDIREDVTRIMPRPDAVNEPAGIKPAPAGSAQPSPPELSPNDSMTVGKTGALSLSAGKTLSQSQVPPSAYGAASYRVPDQAGAGISPLAVMPANDEFSDEATIEPGFVAAARSASSLEEDEEPLINPEVAEAIIPLNEPEIAPKLILLDDAQTALENLIADHPKRDWFKPAQPVREVEADTKGDSGESGNYRPETAVIAAGNGQGAPLRDFPGQDEASHGVAGEYAGEAENGGGTEVNAEEKRAVGGDTAMYLKAKSETDTFSKQANETDLEIRRSGDTDLPSKSAGENGSFLIQDKAVISRTPFKRETGPVTRGKVLAKGQKEILAGVELVEVSPALLAVIEKRLVLYQLLADFEEERNLLRMNRSRLPQAALNELDRQTAELDNLPISDEIDRMMQELRSLQEVREGGIPEGREPGQALPEEYSPELRQADDLAVAQWLAIRESNARDLPVIFREAYAKAADEPLAVEFTKAQISFGKLLGGGIYLLALETLSERLLADNREALNRLRRLDEEGEADGMKDGLLSKLGGIGRLANKFRNRKTIQEESGKIKEAQKSGTARLESIQREMVFMEKFLIKEFRSVYANAALVFCQGADMPVAVRAFLRYGVIGFKPWWMNDEIRDFILRDCQDNVVSGFEWGSTDLNVVYADEYLAGVGRMECTPSPDESLVYLEKNSMEWKTERAYRRIINSRGYNVLMEEMLSNIEAKMRQLELQAQALEDEMTLLRTKPLASKNNIFDLQTEHQAVMIRRDNLKRQYKRIEKEVVFSILESVEEAEGRFRKGELKMPAGDVLIRRECRAFNDLSFTMRGGKERFLPMVIRESFLVNGDVVNERGVVRSNLTAIEELDPGVFLNTIIGAKKKENRVELRLTPVVVIVPCLGSQCVCAMAREGMDGGHIMVPTILARAGARQKLFGNVLADYRWETSRELAGRDSMKSDTLVGVFTKIRWEWRNFAKAKREKGLIYNDLSEVANWRRVYELYLSDANSGARQLFIRNRDLYDSLVGKYIDLPEGVKILRQFQNSAGSEGDKDAEEEILEQ